jgi:hypothetical protein
MPGFAKILVAAVGVVAVAVVLLGPMSTENGYSCDGLGGAVRWQFGAGAAAQARAARQETDMAKILQDLQSDPSLANTPMGREARDDANDGQTRAKGVRPDLNRCDHTARAPAGRPRASLFAAV